MTTERRTSKLRVAFIGNSLPRRCGIATFTTDLRQAIADTGAVETAVVAMTDPGHRYDYPPAVAFEIDDASLDAYVRAADHLNRSGFEVVSLQHEFGIFGGEAGSHVLALLARLDMPVVTTLHTVLAKPTEAQRRVLDRIIDLSARLVVMAEKGRELLRTLYRVPADKIDVIPHGIPDFDFVDPEPVKQKLGFAGRTVILTFGLLSPNKGIEVMIDAMPEILKEKPDAVYVVLGATHPNLVREQGETYRDGLKARAASLGIEDHVVFQDQFVDRDTLLDYIAMCDLYVTPYLNEAQMTSGTLAYSFGLGKAVVSTPYWHANELLADGRGVLVPFGDAAATGAAIRDLLTDEPRRTDMRKRAYASSRAMTWPSTAARYRAVFDAVRRQDRIALVGPRGEEPRPVAHAAPPAVQLAHLYAMCDDTGLFQHAVHSVPDRHHGYCIDDNARALLVACALAKSGEQRLPDALTARFAAFIQHAWNPDNLRFRNFMSFDRRWLEARGSEDSHGRTLWALGEASVNDPSSSRRSWAASLFIAALPAVETFRSPRAWAFALLGLAPYCAAFPRDRLARRHRDLLAERLMSIFSKTATSDWVWFEDGLAYDNARLPEALIVSGMASGHSFHVAAGLDALRWLVSVQTAPSGCFRPVGSASFGDQRQPPLAFDQQPLEATATISACLAAWRVDGGRSWIGEARRAFAWFLGDNDLGISLVDPETGSCRDGLHPDRANENRGGESVVSYLLSLAEMRELARASGDQLRRELRAVRA
ncbi:glycosyltransferase family 4 protein [Kaistia adipata]|uniref:glycosyltransferase family 4 protein n=1 Tax=Kaistia adipata TaxID=166954 RepID=UPI00040D4D93|nr:glycosyltransferase family 4 protein [Kaistia adipata]